jgi:hypothetical protein
MRIAAESCSSLSGGSCRWDDFSGESFGAGVTLAKVSQARLFDSPADDRLHF